jgi:Pyruvate/2-oxoacid:ferredoxin oxidoreductase delta subunit
MKKHHVLYELLIVLLIIVWSGSDVKAASEPNPCIDCHSKETPAIVEQWNKSKHSENEVVCQLCHLAGPEDQSAIDHYGFSVTSNLTIVYCEGCHATPYYEMEASKDKNGVFSHAPLK